MASVFGAGTISTGFLPFTKSAIGSGGVVEGDLPCKGLFKSNCSTGVADSPSVGAPKGLMVKGKLGARTPGFSWGVFLER